MTTLDPGARSILAEGRQLHVAVLATTGPHVTPELYATSGDDLWFATAASTLKTRVIRRNPRIAGLVRAGSRTLVVTGDATDYDLADPKQLVTHARDGLRALSAITSFTLRNAADLGGFARDLAAGRLPSRLPPRRVLVRLRPQRWAVLDGTALGAVGGPWPGRVSAPDETPAMPGRRDAVVGLQVSEEVLALPARIGDAPTSATVPAALAQLAGVAADESTPACMVVDDYVEPGPAAKRGTLLRGRATVTFDGALARVQLTPERETTWDGVRTRTEDRPTS